MKRGAGALVVLLLAGSLLAAPALAANSTVRARFTVKGTSVDAIEAKAQARLAALDPSATWTISYIISSPDRVAIGGGQFGYRWTAYVRATAS